MTPWGFGYSWSTTSAGTSSGCTSCRRQYRIADVGLGLGNKDSAFLHQRGTPGPQQTAEFSRFLGSSC
jgi:hypothetical protein